MFISCRLICSCVKDAGGPGCANESATEDCAVAETDGGSTATGLEEGGVTSAATAGTAGTAGTTAGTAGSWDAGTSWSGVSVVAVSVRGCRRLSIRPAD